MWGRWKRTGVPTSSPFLAAGGRPHKTWKWADARKLFQFGLEHYQMKNVYESQTFAPVPVTGGLCWSEPGKTMRERIELTMGPGDEEREVKLLLGEDGQVEIRQNLPARLKAPVRQGQQVGTVEYLPF